MICHVYTTPNDLQPDVHASVYTGDDPPVQNHVVGLMAMGAKMPMRSTHSTLPDSRARSSKASMEQASIHCWAHRSKCSQNEDALARHAATPDTYLH